MSDAFLGPPVEVRDPEGLREKERAYFALADQVRGLLDSSIRTKLDPARVDAITAQLQQINAELLEVASDGPLGPRVCSDGRRRSHANPAAGARNGFAPPIKITSDRAALRVATPVFNLGAAYEGPPGHVHGGVLAMILDQVLGSVPPLVGKPGMTAYLNVTYRRPSPLLTDLRGEAWVARTDGWKTYVAGHILDADDRVTAEAEALFIVPRIARDFLSQPMSDAAELDLPQK